ncbi:MAG: hypothetical protein Q8942_07715 [Bacillota bacterium]|nr:hypothetical protein [Bacillota bacterium]
MIIKKVEIAGFKNITFHEPKQFEFYAHTIIRGENYSGKTSLGDALCWVFCGCAATGISSEYLLCNDDSSKIIVEVTFEDNFKKEHILLREQSKDTGRNYRLLLDGLPVKEADLSPYIMDKDIFLSTFMIGYFARLSSKQGRELLMSILPFPTHQSIVNKVDSDLRQFLPSEDNFDSNAFIRKKRSDLKLVEDEIKLWLEKQRQAEEQLNKAPSGGLIDEDQLKARVNMLENRKENLLKASMQNNSAGFLEGKLSILRLEIQSLKNKLSSDNTQYRKNCPTCNQPIPEDERRRMEEKLKADNSFMKLTLEDLKKDEEALLVKIEEARNKTNEANAIQEELSSVVNELNLIKADYDAIIRKNEALKSQINAFEEAKVQLEATKNHLEKLYSQRYQHNRSITAVSQYNSIKAEKQYDTIRGSLKNVSIRFQRIAPSNNELKDCFEILYKGRELQVISTSETIRAGLEISNLINSRSNLTLPIFIDNAESITHYEKPSTQIFEAKVEKDAVLTVSPCV